MPRHLTSGGIQREKKKMSFRSTFVNYCLQHFGSWEGHCLQPKRMCTASPPQKPSSKWSLKIEGDQTQIPFYFRLKKSWLTESKYKKKGARKKTRLIRKTCCQIKITDLIKPSGKLPFSIRQELTN